MKDFVRTARSPLSPRFFILAALIVFALTMTVPVPVEVSLFLARNYLPIHTILEFISILVSFAVFTVGYATYQNVRSTDILVLSMLSLGCGWLDLAHTLSYTGMPAFVTPSGPNKAIAFWLTSRLTSAIGFLYMSLSEPRSSSPRLRSFLLTVTLLWTALVTVWILWFPEWVPSFFVPGVGLTSLKLLFEWANIFLSATGGALFILRGWQSKTMSFEWLGVASLLLAMTGLFFTQYSVFEDFYNFSGHVFKAVGYLLIYRAVFVECISLPYEEARQSALEASRANASKSRFLANVSHELRTPLGVISGFGDLLVKSPEVGVEPRRWAGMINRNAKQLRALIDDLLDLAKAENETVTIEYSDFAVGRFVEDVLASFRLTTDKKKVALTFEDRVGAVVRSDENRLGQILVNLVGNAVKFTERGEIAVRAERRPDGSVEFTIRDSGIGIAARDVPRLFQPFAQADDPSLRRFGGTGLGLALSKKLSALLGGDLRLVESDPGRGSTFAVTIADRPDQPLTTPPETADSRGDDLRGRRVLAAEDSEDNRELLAVYLAKTGAHLTFAHDGVEALALAARESFDLILMDIQMPRMDGFEATMKLRESGWGGPILALTAHAHGPERDRALRDGFTGYVTKPVSRDALLAAIGDALKA